jgi:hypothetical protein
LINAVAAPKTRPGTNMSISAEEGAQKQFDADDKRWNGPKLIGLGAVVLFIAISAIFVMSYFSGCSLQIVP